MSFQVSTIFWWYNFDRNVETATGADPVSWSDIIIHLRDFHAMMAFYGVIGTYVAGSGFEDVLFQAGLCSSGNITGILSGKYYKSS